MYQDSYSKGGGPSFGLPSLTPAVKRLLIINVGVFLAIGLSLAFVEGGVVMDFFGLSSANVFDGFGLGLLRFVSYQFVHDYSGIGHLLFNMLGLYFFGTMVEGVVGRANLFRLYLISGALGGLLHMLMAVGFRDQPPVVVGASGAVFGIMVYAAFLAPRSRVWFIIFPVQLGWLVGILVFAGIYASWMELLGKGGDGVSHGAHLGGALWGFVAYRYQRRLMVQGQGQGAGLGGKISRWREQRAQKSERKEQEVMDELLEKIKREGMSALTGAERRFMERLSKKKSGR